MTIYRLESDVSQYEVLTPSDSKDWTTLDLLEGRGVSVKDQWKPFWVEARAPNPAGFRLVGDFPYLGSLARVFSGHAVEALADLLAPAGELLPLLHRDTKYMIFNILLDLDALDEARSSVIRFQSTGRIKEIVRFAFVRERIEQFGLFCIPQLSKAELFVTDDFKALVEKSNLLGFRFIKLTN